MLTKHFSQNRLLLSILIFSVTAFTFYACSEEEEDVVTSNTTSSSSEMSGDGPSYKTMKFKGDIEIDAHHTVEDLGWSIGGAINKAIEKRIGIHRYYSISLPMDEALTICSVDISGRPWLEWRVILQNAKIGGIESEVFREFFQAFSQAAKLTLHIENKYGSNSHHVIESCFKALAICLKNSLTIDKENVDIIPSTKGKID